jgi:hypothetical protein
MLKKMWNDPVWSKVIAAGILALIGVITAWLFKWNWWSPTWHAVQAVYCYFRGEITVKRWLFWLLATASGILVVSIIALLVVLFSQSRTQPSSIRSVPLVNAWLLYKQDTFYDILWRWGYVGNTLGEILPFCPKCDYQMLIRSNGFSSQFNCDLCGQSYRVQKEWDELRTIIARLIDQKIRSKTFPVPPET